MEAIYTFLQNQFAHNQLFSGGLVLMVGGALLAYCREVPARAWAWCKQKMIIEIDVLDRDPAFEWIEQWLAQHTYAKERARSLTVKTMPVDYKQRESQPGADTRPRILFTPAPGSHWLFYRGRLVILHRERPKLNHSVGQPVNVRESFSITIFSRDRSVARQLLEDARDVALPPGESRLSIYRSSYSNWSEQLQRLPRSPDSVILRDNLMNQLITDVRQFLLRREWYADRGIPYRRGYLLYGPPGTGKSSAVVAVASALKMDIAMLSLSSSSLDDNEVAELLANVPVNSLVLIEDIDCGFVDRNTSGDKSNKLTFSGLLNALDGVAAGEGRVLFATTNHRERLDPALVRPGRIDRQEEIGYATGEQAKRMYLRFFPDGDPTMVNYFAEEIPNQTLTMSAIQTHLIRYAHDADEVLANLDELLATVNIQNGNEPEKASFDAAQQSAASVKFAHSR